MLFTQKWIEDAVKKALNIQDGIITEKNIAQIKYLHIGESFNNNFFIQISLENPPLPFVTTDGGDEWGFCCVRGNNLRDFIDEVMEDEKNNIDIELSLGLSDYKDEELYQYAYSEQAEKLWDTFQENIAMDTYYKEFKEDDAFEAWYEQTQINTAIDIANFKGVQVLRIQGLLFDGFKMFQELPELKVLELVETIFHSIDEIENLKNLQQLCCWMD